MKAADGMIGHFYAAIVDELKEGDLVLMCHHLCESGERGQLPPHVFRAVPTQPRFAMNPERPDDPETNDIPVACVLMCLECRDSGVSFDERDWVPAVVEDGIIWHNPLQEAA